MITYTDLFLKTFKSLMEAAQVAGTLPQILLLLFRRNIHGYRGGDSNCIYFMGFLRDLSG